MRVLKQLVLLSTTSLLILALSSRVLAQGILDVWHPLSGCSDLKPGTMPIDLDGDGVGDQVLMDSCRLYAVSGSDSDLLWQSQGSFFDGPIDATGGQDWDGDGVPDLFVLCVEQITTNFALSWIVVVSGVNGVDLRREAILPPFGGERSAIIELLGDLNADGIQDLAVSNPLHVFHLSSKGSVAIFSGSSFEQIRFHEEWGDPAGDHYGSAMANLGDVDLDGVSDYAIGAPDFDHDQLARVYAYSGSTGQLLWTLTSGGSTSQELGVSLVSIADINGDGARDVAVGAPETFLGASGRIILVSGRPILNGLLSTLEPEPNNETVGRFVQALGDLNGDGYDELGAGLGSDSSDDRASSALIVDSLDRAILWRDFGRTTEEGLSYWSGGDRNLDGYGDFVVVRTGEDSSSGITPMLESRVGGFQMLSMATTCTGTINSSGQVAVAMATGIPAANSNSFGLTVMNAPSGVFGYFLASRMEGSIVNPGGAQGVLCLGGGAQIVRLKSTTGTFTNGDLFAVQDLTNIPETPFHPTVIQSGDMWFFQAWFRDGATSNFSSSVRVQFQ